MNALVTRRSLLGATAALSAIGLPIIAEAVTASPDAELFRLLDCWEAMNAARPAMEASLDAVMDLAHAAYPSRPNELYPSSHDRLLGLGATPSGRGAIQSGRPRFFFDHGDVERLRAWRAPVRRVRVGEDNPELPQFDLNDAGEARRREIVEAYDGWMRGCQAAKDKTGFTAANDAWEAEVRAMNAVEETAKLCPPRTLAGLARKAAWVADLLASGSAEEDLGEVFARQVAAFGVAA